MEFCTKCGNGISAGSEYCNKCGAKVGISEEPKVDHVHNTTQKKSDILKIFKSKWLIASIVVVILVVGSVFIYNSYFTLEGQGKRVVTGYVKAIKSGDLTDEFTGAGVDDLIYVKNYKFLNSSSSKVDSTWKYTREDYDMRTPSDLEYEICYECSVNHWKEFYKAQGGGKVISEDTDSITLENGKQHDEIIQLYDMQLINGAGESIFKQVYFTLENDDYGKDMKITEITY